MAHYAKVEKGVVTQVLVAEIEFFDTFVDSSPGEWVQTSYNTKKGVHINEDESPSGQVALRKNYAVIGGSYDISRDAFIPPKIYSSWILNEDTCQYEAPVAHPADGKRYDWDEATTNWKEVI